MKLVTTRNGALGCRSAAQRIICRRVVTLNPVLVTSWLNAALDYCFPGACAACKSTCEGRLPLCAKCMAQLDALGTAPACRHCAAPLAYEDAPCPHCLDKGSPLLDRVVAVGLFLDPLRQMIHAVKYHRAWPFAEDLADPVLAKAAAQSLLTETNLLVPVPLHFTRQLSRGYNQAALI